MIYGDILLPHSRNIEALCTPQIESWHQWMQNLLAGLQILICRGKMKRPTKHFPDHATWLSIANGAILEAHCVFFNRNLSSIARELAPETKLSLCEACDCKPARLADWSCCNFPTSFVLRILVSYLPFLM